MSSENLEELDALIIRNLGDVDIAAHRVYYEIEPRVGNAINELVRDWASKNGWTGDFDWEDVDNYNLEVGPPDWETKEGWLGRFHLDAGVDDTFENKEEDLFWLTRLCRKGRGMLGFRWFYGDGLGTNRSKWKRFVRDNAKLGEAIVKKGFVFEESGLFFIGILVDTEMLAIAIQEGENSLEAALKPMQSALDKLLNAKPEFDALLKGAQDAFR